MAEQTQGNPGLREQAGALKDELSPSRLEGALEDAVSERPMMRHLLAFDTVLKALGAAVVVALVLMILVSAKLAALALVVVFFGAWLGLARLSYDRRRDTRETRGDDGDEDSESD